MGSFFFHQRNNYCFHNLLDVTLFLQNQTFVGNYWFQKWPKTAVFKLDLLYLTALQVQEVLLLPPVWSFVCVCPSLGNGGIEKKCSNGKHFCKIASVGGWWVFQGAWSFWKHFWMCFCVSPFWWLTKLICIFEKSLHLDSLGVVEPFVFSRSEFKLFC